MEAKAKTDEEKGQHYADVIAMLLRVLSDFKLLLRLILAVGLVGEKNIQS